MIYILKFLEIRKRCGLSHAEYDLLEIIRFLGDTSRDSQERWVTRPRSFFEKEMDLGERAIRTLIQGLEKKGYLERNEMRYLRVTQEWRHEISDIETGTKCTTPQNDRQKNAADTGKKMPVTPMLLEIPIGNTDRSKPDPELEEMKKQRDLVPCIFANSKWARFDDFKKWFEKEIEAGIDIKHYWTAMHTYSDKNKMAAKGKATNWIRRAKDWIEADTQRNGKPKLTNGTTMISQETIDKIEARAQRMHLFDGVPLEEARTLVKASMTMANKINKA